MSELLWIGRDGTTVNESDLSRVNVVIKRTVLGWFNIYYYKCGKQVDWENISPKELSTKFPEVDGNAGITCIEAHR